MGTPEFAVPSLKALIDNGYNVVGVITAPDRQSGRGRKIKMSAVKEYAISQDLKVLQPTNLKDREFQSELESLNPNLQIVVAFRMLPKTVWELPEYGTFNLHASLLPQYRGAAPINYAIINGEKETGLTTFFLDEKIDTGKILLQDKIEISINDNAGTLHDKLMILGSSLVIKTVEGIVNQNIEPIPQNEADLGSEPKKAYKISKDDCKIDWNNDQQTINNFIRGLSPYPAAFTSMVNNSTAKRINVKIFDVEFADAKIPQSSPGTINLIDNFILVTCRNGFLKINELQVEGKKRLKSEDFLRGFVGLDSYSFI